MSPDDEQEEEKSSGDDENSDSAGSEETLVELRIAEWIYRINAVIESTTDRPAGEVQSRTNRTTSRAAGVVRTVLFGETLGDRFADDDIRSKASKPERV